MPTLTLDDIYISFPEGSEKKRTTRNDKAPRRNRPRRAPEITAGEPGLEDVTEREAAAPHPRAPKPTRKANADLTDYI